MKARISLIVIVAVLLGIVSAAFAVAPAAKKSKGPMAKAPKTM